MCATIALDDDLLAKAQALTRIQDRSALVNMALKALVERETARRLALLAGSQPDLLAMPRRRAGSAR